MNYEDKYNKTIESIKRIYDQADSFGKELMEKEFPELRESEDERIRKELIAFLERKQLIPTETKNEWIAWLEKQGEQKSSWSEDDEARLETTIKLIEENPYNSKQVVNGIVNWLKSLKPQKHWKPSEEQMEALDKAKNNPANYYDIRLGLQSLYNDLLKL